MNVRDQMKAWDAEYCMLRDELETQWQHIWKASGKLDALREWAQLSKKRCRAWRLSGRKARAGGVASLQLNDKLVSPGVDDGDAQRRAVEGFSRRIQAFDSHCTSVIAAETLILFFNMMHLPAVLKERGSSWSLASRRAVSHQAATYGGHTYPEMSSRSKEM